MTHDEREVRQAHSTWVNAVNAGDLVRLMASMTDDAVFLNPGQAPVDRAGFSSGFSVAHQQARIHCPRLRRGYRSERSLGGAWRPA